MKYTPPPATPFIPHDGHMYLYNAGMVLPGPGLGFYQIIPNLLIGHQIGLSASSGPADAKFTLARSGVYLVHISLSCIPPLLQTSGVGLEVNGLLEVTPHARIEQDAVNSEVHCASASAILTLAAGDQLRIARKHWTVAGPGATTIQDLTFTVSQLQ
jgi:hypothetical protein